jgi:predicted glycoside hydrolase/deacetylase ChbG (UPF0249 family)
VADASRIRLVVNADGFRLEPAVCRGVLRAHREGVVTSTSVLGNCADPGEVRRVLDEAPQLGIGAHLTLVGGEPVAGAGAVRSLVGADGRFPAHARDVLMSWAKNVLRADDVEREFDAQISRLRDAGLRLDHLSTRAHLGFLPSVGRAVEALARRHGIPGIRMAMERPSLAWVVEAQRGVMAAALGGLGWLTRRQLGTLRYGPQTWGYVESGHLDEIRILEIIGRLGPGPHELICHPMDIAADGELAALTSTRVKQALARRDIQLCRWAELF